MTPSLAISDVQISSEQHLFPALCTITLTSAFGVLLPSGIECCLHSRVKFQPQISVQRESRCGNFAAHTLEQWMKQQIGASC
jgi:hypothetical protein